jgi:galactose mutarotase-like enzyme
MFPVNVRFKDERFTYQGKVYEMPRMGLAITSLFSILDHKKESVVLGLSSNKETLKHYPFHFELEITFFLKENGLVNTFQVSNEGSDTMYFALGGHPGFRLHTSKSTDRSAFQYTFSKVLNVSRIEIAESLVQHRKIPFLSNERNLKLNDKRIPNGGMFMQNSISKEIGVGLIGQEPYVTVDLGDFPNVNLWSPPGMPFACIEPMVSHHDLTDSPIAIEEKSFLAKLGGGTSSEYAFTIKIHE